MKRGATVRGSAWRVSWIMAIVAVVVAAGMLIAPFAIAQISTSPDDRFAGLQWTFARIKYNSYPGPATSTLRLGYWDEPWAIDAPAAEQNLSRRLGTVTSIQVTDPLSSPWTTRRSGSTPGCISSSRAT